jgi:hypothetical protein
MARHRRNRPMPHGPTLTHMRSYAAIYRAGRPHGQPGRRQRPAPGPPSAPALYLRSEVSHIWHIGIWKGCVFALVLVY